MASNDALLMWTALNNEPPDANFATLDTILTASADEPDDIIPVLDFDPGSTDEYAVFSGVMPEHYAGTTGVTLTIMWSSDATTGNCIWDAAFKSFTDDADDMDTKAYAAVNSVTGASWPIAEPNTISTIIKECFMVSMNVTSIPFMQSYQT